MEEPVAKHNSLSSVGVSVTGVKIILNLGDGVS